MKLLLIIIFCTPVFLFSQKLQKLTIKEARLVFNESEYLHPGKRLKIGILVQAFKKKPDNIKDFRTPTGYFPKGNIGWGEFKIEIEGGRFNKSKGQLIVGEDPKNRMVKIIITNRFNKELKIEKSIPINFGGAQRVDFEGEKGVKGYKGQHGGYHNVPSRKDHSETYHGENGGPGYDGNRGDSIEVFVALKKDELLGDLLNVRVVNKISGESFYTFVNPEKNGSITITCKGGKGGRGGKGGNGEKGHEARGGDGGVGGKGGPGGVITAYIDFSAKKYIDNIHLISEGGDPGEHGKGGKANYRVTSSGSKEYGRAGRMGLNGAKGEKGPDPKIKFVEVESDWE
jgi:hypothetical protein